MYNTHGEPASHGLRGGCCPRPANLIRIMPAEGCAIKNPLQKQRKGVFSVLNTIILANGALSIEGLPMERIRSADLLLVADGGFHHSGELGLTPHALIGDLDSLSEEDLSRIEAEGIQVHRHPRRKDATDLELALDYALESGSRDITVLGALGARWDQSLANVLVGSLARFRDVRLTLLDGYQELTLLSGGESLELSGRPGEIVSLVPLSERAEGLRSQGLEYPLEGISLTRGSTLGISNALTQERAQIQLDNGLLICILIHRTQGELEGHLKKEITEEN